MLKLDPKRTALVAIDLQKGILGMPIAPHPAAAVVANSTRLAEALTRAGGRGRPRPRRLLGRRRRPAASRRSTSRWPAARVPPDWMDFVAEVAAWKARARDRQAPVGRLPRHGARSAAQAARPRHDRPDRRRHQFRRRADGARGLAARLFGRRRRRRDQLVVSEAAHRFAVETILPRVSRVRSTEAIVAALA